MKNCPMNPPQSACRVPPSLLLNFGLIMQIHKFRKILFDRSEPSVIRILVSALVQVVVERNISAKLHLLYSSFPTYIYMRLNHIKSGKKPKSCVKTPLFLVEKFCVPLIDCDAFTCEQKKYPGAH
jgi:hypothetical protein